MNPFLMHPAAVQHRALTDAAAATAEIRRHAERSAAPPRVARRRPLAALLAVLRPRKA
jgi:hypothetical protein